MPGTSQHITVLGLLQAGAGQVGQLCTAQGLAALLQQGSAVPLQRWVAACAGATDADVRDLMHVTFVSMPGPKFCRLKSTSFRLGLRLSGALMTPMVGPDDRRKLTVLQ